MTASRPWIVETPQVAMWKDLILRGTGFPASLVLETAAAASVAAITAALEDERRGVRTFAAARPAIEAAFSQDTARISELLRGIVRMPAFREAVLWQNRGALHGAMESLLRRPVGAVDSKTREYEKLVASYLQRYCVKNDTIGFFGPVGWGTFDANLAAAATLAPGPALVSRRTVYFEHWAIDLLAQKLSEDRTLRATLAPHPMPTIWLEGDVLHHPIDKVSPLDPTSARLVRACDGKRSARAIAEALVADPAAGLASVEEAYDLLDELVDAHVIRWCLEVPTTYGFHPERALREAIAAAEPSPVRDAAETSLTELEAARAKVSAAAGDPDSLDAAMVELDETFVRIAGAPASRGAGQTYAGRRIIFEDCRRDFALAFGKPFLDHIGPPLALIQTSARWFTHTVAARFAAVFSEVYRALVAEIGAPEVDFIRFYAALRPHLTTRDGVLSSTVREVQAELHRRWAEILAVPEGANRVEHEATTLAAKVEASFAAPGPGWPAARHNAPDLMIAAAGPEALARGEFFVVLGEVHAGLTGITIPTLAKEHLDPTRLYEARRQDLGRGIAMVEPRASVRRASTYSQAVDDLDVEFGDARSPRPRDHVFDVAGFVVTESGDRLVARRRDGSTEFDLVAFLEGDLGSETFNFDILAPSAHRPRITIGGLVVTRERWSFEGALPFAKLAAPLDRFIAVRRWAAEQGLPRFLFVKASEEPKPMYLDLDSPIYVEIFCKLARSGGRLGLSEMLPTFDQLWLQDAAGASYCSELRTCMVDDHLWPHVAQTTRG